MTERDTLHLSIRRVFDWRGSTGIEIQPQQTDLLVYAGTIREALADLEQLMDERQQDAFIRAYKQYHIEPPMSVEEKWHIDESLQTWVAENKGS
ncbi:hypothetical protein FLK61_36210 [Paenalkalicoccus suaedae]|uniref:Uncharacterized protein n=1 Tax=Paenalkalicoccus suaedae TaxID=2592382 RepID=A0A859FG77_9BACI|nr:hypothetical protein [Paenalkalicoccus suaedae]QKS72107.1 hypothetical protein FLK61_36210 [Paenalkalicoccus suaedae]